MSTVEKSKEFDIVVFGATGFTGQFVVEEIARTVHEEAHLTWAIAGRNLSKLQNVLKEASSHTGRNVESTPIMQADVGSVSSLNDMCNRAKVILNCVGPYQFYGEPVVRACIANKAHHVDISGEAVFHENIDLVYNDQAKDAGVYIMEACGFDSIPIDMGIVYIKQQFTGDLNHVEDYLTITYGSDGARLNIGTLQSGLHGYNLKKFRELREIRRKRNPTDMTKSNHPTPKRGIVFYSNECKGWCMPSAGSDKAVVTRSLRYNYEYRNQRPLMLESYRVLPGIWQVMMRFLMGLIFGIFSNFSLGRKLMETFPRVMTFGLFDKEGPTTKQVAETSFTLHMVGYGHDEQLADVHEQHADKPIRKITTRVSGPDMAYSTTPICMVQVAYTLLSEQDKLPQGGGVFTPGAAFTNTNLIDRLNKHNVRIETIQRS